MIRWLVPLALTACGPSLDDRLAELDERATVDCGEINECNGLSQVEALIACMNDSLAAGSSARALIYQDIDLTTFVYTLDGAFVTIDVIADLEEPEGHESECAALEAVSTTLCHSVNATGCRSVREWTD